MEQVIAKFEELRGQVLKEIKVSDSKDQIDFYTENDRKYSMYHSQDCCEAVYIEDICGDLDDLIGKPLMMAEEIIHDNENPEGVKAPHEYQERFAWTFYKLATMDGYVTIRWYGESNGYYSVDVNSYKNKMTKSQAIKSLNNINGGDGEDYHCDADGILLEFLEDNGHGDIVEAYKGVQSRASFWAYA